MRHIERFAICAILSLLCRGAGADSTGDAVEPLDRPADALARLQKVLPPRFQEYESKRYVIVSDAGVIRAREQLERLDRVYHEFDRFARRLELPRRPLEHKLVCVLFKERAEYRAFAQREDQVHADWVAGYYAPQHDWIVFYDVQSNPSVTEAKERISDLRRQQRELDRAYARVKATGTHKQRRAASEQRIERQRMIDEERARIETFASRVSITTTVHEAIHQLLFHTGVQDRSVHYPLWLSEGMATAFETEHINHAFGPAFQFEPRQAAFRERLKSDDLLPVRDLATLMELKNADEATRQIVYDQSYALITWLCRARPKELRAYLARCGELGSEPTTDELLAAFTDSFGSPEQLERRWLREEHAVVWP